MFAALPAGGAPRCAPRRAQRRRVGRADSLRFGGDGFQRLRGSPQRRGGKGVCVERLGASALTQRENAIWYNRGFPGPTACGLPCVLSRSAT